MKKGLKNVLVAGIFACVLGLTAALPMTALAEEGDPSIIQAPQSYLWQVGDDAEYYCTVDGDPAKLFTYDWHIVYNGVDYRVFDADGHQTWENGDPANFYGSDNDRLYFSGIHECMDGMEVYCIVSRSTGSVESPHAMIMVTTKNTFDPPAMNTPVEYYCTQGEKISVTCTASSRGSGNLGYEWMECSNGNLMTAQLIGWKSGNLETGKSFVPDTSQVGTRWYVCRVTDGAGQSMENISYSNITKVVVEPGSGASGGTSGGFNIVTGNSGGNSVTVTNDTPTAPSKDKGDREPVQLDTMTIVLIAVGAVLLAGIIVLIVLLAKSGKKQQGTHKH